MAGARVIGLELLVADLDRAVELVRDVLGLPVLDEGPAANVAGRMATVDAGGLVLTLLEPTDSGPGPVLGDRTPRLAQVVVGTDGPADVVGLLARVTSAGLAAVPIDDHRFHVPPEAVQGALGLPVAVVVVPAPAEG